MSMKALAASIYEMAISAARGVSPYEIVVKACALKK